jgi:hypothetical protein
MGLTEAHQRLAAGDAVLRLQRARPVIKPGVNHTAVVPGLVGRQALLALQDHERAAPALAQRHRRGQADDATADHRHVVAALIHFGNLHFPARSPPSRRDRPFRPHAALGRV